MYMYACVEHKYIISYKCHNAINAIYICIGVYILVNSSFHFAYSIFTNKECCLQTYVGQMTSF